MSVASVKPQGLLALSDEVLVLVLSFLESDGDLLSCSQVSKRLRTLASDKSLVTRLNLRRDLRVTKDNFKSFFSIPSTCTKVVSLNLNGVYWIPAGALQAQIVKMKNLQELHVGDVLFSARQFSGMLNGLSQLRKLSFTWHWLTDQEVEEVTQVRISNLEELNIFLATGDRCMLDRLTWLLARCHLLRHLSVISQVLSEHVKSSASRFDIVINTRLFRLPALITVVWAIKNETYPELLVRNIENKLKFQVLNRELLPSWFFSKHNQHHHGIPIPIACLYPNQYPGDPDQGYLCLNEMGISQSGHVTQSPSCAVVPVNISRNLTELWLSFGHNLFCKFEDRSRLGRLQKLHCDIKFLCYTNDEELNEAKTQQELFQIIESNLKNMKKLKHLEIGMSLEPIGGLVLEALASAAPQLEHLRLGVVKIGANHNKSLSKLLESCQNITHLELFDINCPAQRLLTDLERGLKGAKRLKTLNIHQKQMTQYSARLLDSLSANCPVIEQVVLEDTSRAFTLKKFPTEKVIKLAHEKKSLKLLYICSELLTIEDVKSTKRNLKSLLQERPYLLVKLQPKLGREKGKSGPVYSLEVCELPMEFQRSVTTLSDKNYRCSSVASFTLNDIF